MPVYDSTYCTCGHRIPITDPAPCPIHRTPPPEPGAYFGRHRLITL